MKHVMTFTPYDVVFYWTQTLLIYVLHIDNYLVLKTRSNCKAKKERFSEKVNNSQQPEPYLVLVSAYHLFNGINNIVET
jgi:hypothetical protein